MPSKSRNGWSVAGQPQPVAGAPHLGWWSVERDEIVLEDLDRIEPGVGDGLELLAQCAAQRYRRDRGLHG
jgi:hypothetical protein